MEKLKPDSAEKTKKQSLPGACPPGKHEKNGGAGTVRYFPAIIARNDAAFTKNF